MNEQDKKILWRVIAAFLSCLIPGLGQLIQGRIAVGFVFFIAAFCLWWFFLGWIIHLWAILDAAFYEKPESK